MRFVVRSLVDLFTSPLLITLLLLIVALILRWRGRQRGALITAASAVALLYLSALSLVSDALLRPLESAHRALDDSHLPQEIAGIAVLGSGYVARPGVPITAELSADALSRVAEGVRLAKRYGNGNLRLVLSGGASQGYQFAPSARGYEIFAREMGVDAASIVVIDTPLDTAAEARTITALFGKSPFLLVTSAYHMKRAMLLFEQAGGQPIAAPTGQRVGLSAARFPWLPNARSLASTEYALHEYLGILAFSAGLG